MNKLINKLVQAAGGWEKFLYQTLKEVCDGLAPAGHDAGVGGVVDEAREVLAAYEATTVGGSPIQIPSNQVEPVVEGGSKVVEAHKPVDENIVGTPVAVPKPKPIRQPKNLTARVNVDSEVGASQGELPIPTDYKLSHRDQMFVETQGGIELGRGSPDGQVRGQGVSGLVTLDGKYRLVFKDTNLGAGFIYFTVIQVEKKEKKEKVIEKKEAKEKKEVEKE